MSVVINGSSSVVTNSGAVYDGIQRGTAVTASGTSVDFTGIPSWVKRITVMFSGVSTNGTSIILAKLGTSGGILSTGYTGTVSNLTSGSGGVSTTAGANVNIASVAASVGSGQLVFTNINADDWVWTCSFGMSVTRISNFSHGSVSLPSTLTQVRITTENGTDTFDAGSINILYE
jgi:hypothetical protein